MRKPKTIQERMAQIKAAQDAGDYTRCPRCHEPLDKGVCTACGERVELPPLPTWQGGVFAALFLLATGIFTLWQGLGWKGLPLALGGVACGGIGVRVRKRERGLDVEDRRAVK